MAGKPEVVFPSSKIKLAIVEILKKENYISDFTSQDREIKVVLKYANKKPAISEIKRISTPGRRVYSHIKDVQKISGKNKIVILSTPLGVITNKEAKKKNVGGEVLCEIY